MKRIYSLIFCLTLLYYALEHVVAALIVIVADLRLLVSNSRKSLIGTDLLLLTNLVILSEHDAVRQGHRDL